MISSANPLDYCLCQVSYYYDELKYKLAALDQCQETSWMEVVQIEAETNHEIVAIFRVGDMMSPYYFDTMMLRRMNEQLLEGGRRCIVYVSADYSGPAW
mmetsp:Transcript_29055/g.41530  ORF Transcript_29055/g.41530 Transcript_29055/m.41530 type:complete len:99 (-) Transcript_29055:15-311(-)